MLYIPPKGYKLSNNTGLFAKKQLRYAHNAANAVSLSYVSQSYATLSRPESAKFRTLLMKINYNFLSGDQTTEPLIRKMSMCHFRFIIKIYGRTCTFAVNTL